MPKVALFAFATQAALYVGNAQSCPADAHPGGVEGAQMGVDGDFGPPSGFACRTDDLD